MDNKENIKLADARWEDGDEHNPLSEIIYKGIADTDYNYNDDYFYFKSGGDGDNGETLMYVLDMFFDTKAGKIIADKFNK